MSSFMEHCNTRLFSDRFKTGIKEMGFFFLLITIISGLYLNFAPLNLSQSLLKLCHPCNSVSTFSACIDCLHSLRIKTLNYLMVVKQYTIGL